MSFPKVRRVLAALAFAVATLVVPTTSEANAEINRKAIIHMAASMIGYHYGGGAHFNEPGWGHAAKAGPTSLKDKRRVVFNRKAAALDCSGLTRLAYQRAGINLGAGSAHDQIKRFRRLASKSEALPGDLIFYGTKLKTKKGANYQAPDGALWRVQQVAVYAGGNVRIFSNPKARAVVKEPLTSVGLIGYYRFNGRNAVTQPSAAAEGPEESDDPSVTDDSAGDTSAPAPPTRPTSPASPTPPTPPTSNPSSPTSPTPPVTSRDGLLANGNFDDDVSASHWSRLNLATNMAVIVGSAREGRNHLRTNLGTAASGASTHQDVAITTSAGQSFVATVWVRADDGATGTGALALWGLGGSRSENKATVFTATREWQPVQVTLDTTTAHTTLRFELYMYSNIQYAFDAATLASESYPGGSPRTEAAIAAGRTKIGKTYLLGAAGPDRYDCSGLVVWAFQQTGLAVTSLLGRASYEMYNRAPARGLTVPYAQRQRGDLIFWQETAKGRVGHVAIYLGGNRVLQSNPTKGVHEATLSESAAFRLKTDYVVRLPG